MAEFRSRSFTRQRGRRSQSPITSASAIRRAELTEDVMTARRAPERPALCSSMRTVTAPGCAFVSDKKRNRESERRVTPAELVSWIKRERMHGQRSAWQQSVELRLLTGRSQLPWRMKRPSAERSRPPGLISLRTTGEGKVSDFGSRKSPENGYEARSLSAAPLLACADDDGQ
jgi:hypothetical protein